MPKAVIYARVSTERQAEDEIPIRGQLEACKQYAAAHGLEVVGIYTDEAGHSSWTDERVEFQKMYQAAKEKPRPFDIILAWRGNRLFRRVELRLAYRRHFERYGVKFVSLNEPSMEGAAGQVIETVIATFDEYERALASEDSLRGLKQVAADGYSTGGKPATGYINVRKTTGLKKNGEPVMRTTWEPDPETAPLILKSFQMCAAGATSVEIVNATHVVSNKSSLSTLLRNRAYIGERIYNTTRRASLNDKKTLRIKNDPAAFIVTKHSHPAIVPEELFNQVQFIQDRKRPHQPGWIKKQKQAYLLSGLLYCKEHGVPFVGHTTRDTSYYACGERAKQGKIRASCPWLKKDKIEQFVLEQLKTKIFTRGTIKSGLEYLQSEYIKNQKEDDTEEKSLKVQVSKIDGEITNFKNAIKQGVNASVLADDINSLSGRRTKLHERLLKIEDERIKSARIDITEAAVDDVLRAVNTILAIQQPAELRMALQRFIEKIEVEDRQVTICYTFQDANYTFNWRPVRDSNPRSSP